MPKDRGAEQGDVDGPLECSLASGNGGSRNARGRVAAQQASGSLPWIGVDDPSELQCLQAEHAVSQSAENCQLPDDPFACVLAEFNGFDDVRHAVQKHVGLTDLCDIMCHPILVPS